MPARCGWITNLIFIPLFLFVDTIFSGSKFNTGWATWSSSPNQHYIPCRIYHGPFGAFAFESDLTGLCFWRQLNFGHLRGIDRHQFFLQVALLRWRGKSLPLQDANQHNQNDDEGFVVQFFDIRPYLIQRNFHSCAFVLFDFVSLHAIQTIANSQQHRQQSWDTWAKLW